MPVAHISNLYHSRISKKPVPMRLPVPASAHRYHFPKRYLTPSVSHLVLLWNRFPHTIIMVRCPRALRAAACAQCVRNLTPPMCCTAFPFPLTHCFPTLPAHPSPHAIPPQAAARPTVNVYNFKDGATSGSVALPAVFTTPIRRDLVATVHRDMAKNKRQAYAVNKESGMQHSAESWGTGRAVARIPRISGSGTRRSSQAAFGNMCRQGRMFAPTKIWRKWHRKISVNQRRYAAASAVAATAVTPLVQARGHAVDDVVELPLVVSGLEGVTKTAQALETLTTLGGAQDVAKSKASRKIRAGKGKLRNRRYVQRLGPLVVHDGETNVERSFRNLPGVELCKVDSLNLLQLAPGGHMGRLVVWTEAAFGKLEALWGNGTEAAALKSGYKLPKAIVSNADIGRIINSDEVQSAIRASKVGTKYVTHKKNPLTNLGAMLKLNPHHLEARKANVEHAKAVAAGKAEAARVARRKATSKADAKAAKTASKAFFKALVDDEYTFGAYGK